MGKYWGLEKDNKKTKIKLFKTLLRMRYEMFKYRKNKPYAEYKKEEYDALKSGQPSELSVIEDDKIPKDLNFSIDRLCITEIIDKRNLPKLVSFLRRLIKYVKKDSLAPGTFEEDIQEASNSLEKLQESEEDIATFGRYNITNEEIDYVYIKINNFSDSYCVLNFYLGLKDKVKSNLEHILLDDYKERTVLPLVGIGPDGNYAASTNFSSEVMKEKDYLEECTKFKWKFLKWVNSDLRLPTFLFEHDIPAPSYIFSKINPKYLKNNNYQIKLDTFSILTNNSIDVSTHKLNAKICFPEIYASIIKDYSCYQCLYDRYNGTEEKMYNDKLSTINNELYEENTSLEFIKKLELISIITYNFHVQIEQYFHEIMSIKMHWFKFKKILRKNFSYSKDFYELESICREINIESIKENYANSIILSKNKNLNEVQSLENQIIYNLNQLKKRTNVINELADKKIELIQSMSSIVHEKMLTFFTILTLITSIVAAIAAIIPLIKN